MFRRWPVTTFYLLTLIVSWPAGLLPPGPSIAAIAATALIDGRSGVVELVRRVVVWRVNVGWYLLALLGPLALFALAAGVNTLMGASPVGRLSLDWSEFGRLLLLQIVGVFTGAWEELGWRGYALPRMMSRLSPLVASLGLGVLWAIWHVPLFLAGDIPWADAAFIVAVSVLFTAVFVQTSQSVLIAFLMHASINAAGGVTVLLFEGGDRTQMYWAVSAVTAVVVVAVIAMRPRWWLNPPSGERIATAVGTFGEPD
ncbi:MAG TPA: CPBP family intramembrane glutamic endopeptidase [Acidimicrobiia bacterium]